MKKLLLLSAIAITLLSSCVNKHIYTLSPVNDYSTSSYNYSADIDINYGWDCVVGKDRHFEDITANPHKIGDTIEIVHTDYTTSKYILIAIK